MNSKLLKLILLLSISIFSINLYGQPPNDECAGAIPYPGDVVNEVCLTAYDFSLFSATSISPLPSCDSNAKSIAWFTFTAPVTTWRGDYVGLEWDGGDCGVGIEVFDRYCNSPVSNCLNEDNGLVSGMQQGFDYLLLLWIDDESQSYSNCDFCLKVPEDCEDFDIPRCEDTCEHYYDWDSRTCSCQRIGFTEEFCTDGDPCTDDYFDEGCNCRHRPAQGICPDNTCFATYTWDAETCRCLGTQIEYDCEDNNECTNDYVHPVSCECMHDLIDGCENDCNLAEGQDCPTNLDLIAPTELLDIKFRVSPTELNREGEIYISVDFYNNGPGIVESVDFVWEINGVIVDTTTYNGLSVMAENFVSAGLSNYFFEAATDYTIKVTAVNINGGVDLNIQDNVYEYLLPAFEGAPDLNIKITEPTNPILGPGDIVVNISNLGNVYAFNFVINWSINGDLQTPFIVNDASWNMSFPNTSDLSYEIGSKGFNPTNDYEIKAWIELSEDDEDADLTNNVATFSYFAENSVYYDADETITICEGESITLTQSTIYFEKRSCYVCRARLINPVWTLGNETLNTTSTEITITPTENGFYDFNSDTDTDANYRECIDNCEEEVDGFDVAPYGPHSYKYGIIVLPCDDGSLVGCTDASAPNYNPDAILDDGSCEAATSICDLPPDSGPCDDDIERFYYDKAEGDCKLFSYGGCDGNSNNFENYFVCMENACVEPIECPEGEPLEWNWVQQRIENSDGCFPGSISAFESGGVTYIATSVGGNNYCPTDYPVDYYSCKGNYICYAGGLTAPGVNTGCDFGETTNSRNIWTYSSDPESGCTDACAPNYNPDAILDDGTCEAYDTCPDDTCYSAYIWDEEACNCIEGSIDYEGCEDYNECTNDFRDPETCGCVNEIIENCGDLCNNEPGLMQTASSYVCGENTFYTREVFSQIDKNSVKAYVLHEEKSFNGTDYILIQAGNRFDSPGQSYSSKPIYVSAIIGPPGENGFPKLDDDCTVWTPKGAYVVFFDPIALTVENERCESGQYFVDVSVNGGVGGISPNVAYTLSSESGLEHINVNAGEIKTFGPYEVEGSYLIKVEDAKGCSLDFTGTYACSGLYRVLTPGNENGSYVITHFNPDAEIKSVDAYNLNGQIVKSNTSINGSSCRVEILDNKGIYFVRLLLSNNEVDYIKIIK